MAASDFQNRWKRAEAPADKVADQASVSPSIAEAPAIKPQHVAPPTMEDAAQLQPDSDYTAFVAKGVDENVKRAAMKKLFADPHFNVMDGLDIYIEDFNKFEPIPAAMLAQLNHARQLLDPLGHLSAPVMQMIDAVPATQAPAISSEVQADAVPALPEPEQAASESPAMPVAAEASPAAADLCGVEAYGTPAPDDSRPSDVDGAPDGDCAGTPAVTSDVITDQRPPAAVDPRLPS